MGDPQPSHVRRLSGVASRLSQKMVPSVLKPSHSLSLNVSQPAMVPPPPITTKAPASAPNLNVPGQVAVTNNSADSTLEQLRTYQREGFLPPRQCFLKRVSINRVLISGTGISFRICVLDTTYFDVKLDHTANTNIIETCAIYCENYDKLNARGRALTDRKTGLITHPAFKPGSTLGGWLPHYPIGVLIYLILRLVEDNGDAEQDIANSAVGPYGYELSFNHGIVSLKGKRGTMEDYKTVYPLTRGILLAGVFDGHGGGLAADFAASHVPIAFHSTFATPSIPTDSTGRALAIRRSLKSAIEETDRKFLIETKESAGTTACVAAIDVESLVVHVANVGDSRCTLSRAGQAMDLSVDHKANHPAEIARIVDSGGFVARGRALGLLAISRAIGDRDLKRSAAEISAVSAQADVDTFVLDPVRDEFIVIACDGLFDVMTSQQVVTFIRNRFAEGHNEDTAANALATYAIDSLGSMDNVTVIIISLSFLHLGSATIPGSAPTTPRTARAPTIRRSESATIRAAKASAHKRQTSRMSSTESSVSSLAMYGATS